ncbi:MAG: DNA polymerase [Kofleriaceae bacterium]
MPTDRHGPGGDPVNALFAVARALDRAVAFKQPAAAIAVIEQHVTSAAWPPILRAQLPALRPLLETLGMHVVEAVDELHVVSSYARAALDRGDDVVVVGVDKRYAQLVNDRVWWYDPNKDARYTPEMVHKRFGVEPSRVAEWLALVGDDDAMPGIAGIGAKGATALLQAHGSVEQALATLDAIGGRTGNALRAAGSDAVRSELRRGRLDRDRPLPMSLDAARYVPPSPANVNALFERLGFVELLVHDAAKLQVTVCDRASELEARLAQLAAPVAVHGVIEDGGELIGVALADGRGEPVYASLAVARDALARWLADPRVPKIAYAREGLMVALQRAGLGLAGMIGDAAAASHLTQPSNWAPHDLALVAKHALGRALPADETVRGIGAQRKPWSALPIDRVGQLAGQHADAAAAVWSALSPSVDPALVAEYLELSDALVQMELHGLAIDRDELANAERDFAVIEADLQREIEALAGHPFNINSSKQLGAVLFEQLKLPIASHTKTGWSTSIEALEKIEHAHPIVPLVLRWRLLRRLRDGWIISLRNCIATDGRVHSRFHPARSFSGRLVNTNPDLGRVPGRTPEMARIRRAFVAAPGTLLLSVDYNQLGLHVLAHLTKDPALTEPLRQRADMHALTAAAVLDRPIDQLTPDERQLGKVVNFATFAGQGASALALQLGISAQEAKQLIARFDQRYAMVRAFQDEQLRLARERGYIVTMAGRHWPIGGLESLDPHDRSYAERLARRATHEGSVSDVSRRGLLQIARAIRAAGLRAAPVAQILDEVLLEVPVEELDQTARLAADAMRSSFAPMEVPLVVSVEAGPNWADLVGSDSSYSTWVSGIRTTS